MMWKNILWISDILAIGSSRESHDTTRLQVQREHPAWFRPSSTEAWLPMSSFASLHEQRVKREIKLSTASTGRWAISTTYITSERIAATCDPKGNSNIDQLRYR